VMQPFSGHVLPNFRMGDDLPESLSLLSIDASRLSVVAFHDLEGAGP